MCLECAASSTSTSAHIADDKRHQRQHDAMMNRLMMTVLMATVLNAVQGIATMMQEADNNNKSRNDREVEFVEEGDK